MRVQKRDGSYEDVSFDKVLRRIQTQCADLSGVDAHSIAQRVCTRIYDGVHTTELDELAAQMCASLVTEHPDYGMLASRLIVSNHQKNTSPSFSETMSIMWHARDVHDVHSPLISEELWNIVQANKEKLNSVIEYDRDFNMDYFGFKTLERSYLVRVNGKVVERPQHMWMRVALGIHGSDIKDAIETYTLMSSRYFTHATPTLFNAGTPRPQMSSCFLISMEDSISGIFDTLSDVAEISKNAGGIGMHIHAVRAAGSHIRGTNGTSTGIIPMLRVFNATARYVNQGGKRNGSIAVFLEPSHPDFEKFLDIRKNHGNQEERCLDLFTAAWIPDLFMRRVEANEDWSLFCPDECPGLSDVYGEEYDKLYAFYESAGKARKTVKAQQLFLAMIKSQIETGTPYMLFKDAANAKSNQKNLGTIKSSNLCVEIMQKSDENETAVCNLASIALPTFVYEEEATGTMMYDFDKLHAVAQVVTKNLNKVIDRNFYPTKKCERSNFRHRPVGIGIQGLADTFALMRIPFDSPEAAELNKRIFETIYHGALTASMNIAKKRHELRIELEDPATDAARCEEIRKHLHMTNEEEALTQYRGAYATFVGSPASEGKLQFDLWGAEPYGGWDWAALKAEIAKYGIRNSLLVAPMPTASTSQILGFNESFEPFTSNIYQRRTLAGEFTVINKYLIRDLIKLGIWSVDLKNRILLGNGSVQHLEEIPQNIRDLYKTAWELKQRVIIDQSADRGIYVCQSQSLNLFVEDPEFNKLSNMHFYAWKKGLKTGMYYLRTRPKAKTIAFSIDAAAPGAAAVERKVDATSPVLACRKDDPNCMMCSA